MGKFYIDLERYEDAIEPFEKLIDLSPGSSSDHNGLGMAYLLIGDLDKAQVQFEEAKSLDSKFYSPDINLGLI